MRIPKLIFGDDHGECSLWDISLAKYNVYRERIDRAYDQDADDQAEKIEAELETHKIPWRDMMKYEHGYVPDYAGYLAKVFNLDVESN